MAQTSVHETRRWTRFAPGLVLTALFAVMALVAIGPQDVVESFAQDRLLWSVRPPVDASDDITLIEIDDAALERIQKWPWSWDKMAGILDALTELKARAVVLDIVYSEVVQPQFAFVCEKHHLSADQVVPDERHHELGSCRFAKVIDAAFL